MELSDSINRKEVVKFIQSFIHEIITESGTDKNLHTNEVLKKIIQGLEGFPPSERIKIPDRATNTKTNDEIIKALEKYAETTLSYTVSETLKQAAEALKADEWTPVEESPKVDDYYLVTLKNEEGDKFVGAAEFDPEDGLWLTELDGLRIGAIIAWKKLPEPYKGASK